MAIQPSTIVSGFRKVGVYPFDLTAIKPSNSESTAVTKPSDFITTSTPQHKFESSQVKSYIPSAISFSEDQINLFERRYDNGYDIYDDQMYVAWLQQQHPDDLPVELSLASTSAEDISFL